MIHIAICVKFFHVVYDLSFEPFSVTVLIVKCRYVVLLLYLNIFSMKKNNKGNWSNPDFKQWCVSELLCKSYNLIEEICKKAQTQTVFSEGKCTSHYGPPAHFLPPALGLNSSASPMKRNE